MESEILLQSQRAILLVVFVSGPPILAALVVGLALATVQALTQIQEQTIQVAAKIVAVFAVLLILGPRLAGFLHQYARVIFEEFANWVG
ncbi:MAG: EscS/YscS/HrcS family type III secretion system export apparatus protein [Thermoanaerobaculia bacterium]